MSPSLTCSGRFQADIHVSSLMEKGKATALILLELLPLVTLLIAVHSLGISSHTGLVSLVPLIGWFTSCLHPHTRSFCLNHRLTSTPMALLSVLHKVLFTITICSLHINRSVDSFVWCQYPAIPFTGHFHRSYPALVSV